MKLSKLLVTAVLIGGLYNAFADSENNLIPNGNFSESGKIWELSYREPELGTLTYELDDTPAGAGFVRLAPLNSAAPRFFSLQQKLAEPPPAGRYKLKAWMRISDDYAAAMPRVSIGWQLAGQSGEAGSASVTLDQGVSPGEWVLSESDLELPDGITSTYVFLFTYGSMGHVDFDGISLEPLE